MMDSAAVKRDPIAPISNISSEQTVRLGASHGNVSDISQLFFSPSKVRIEVEAPPLDDDSPEAFPDNAEPTAEEQADAEPAPRASWLDAISVHGEHGAPAEREATFNPDDNGLYRMYLPATA
jgi:hypothetical protein